MEINELIMHWSSFDTNTLPFIHHNDLPYLIDGRTIQYASYQEYISNISYSKGKNEKFHTGLLPIPYIGDLRTAKVFLLMANPGLGHSDYKAEYDDIEYREAVNQNIKQIPDRDYPFFCLNPKFAWTGGFQYWEKKFESLATKLRKITGTSYEETWQLLAKNVVVLELIPYRSKNSCIIRELQSTELIKNFVKKALIPKTEDGSIILVAMRKVEEWGFRKFENHNKNIFIYDSYSAHSASLHKDSVAFDAIIAKIYS
jgi:hypothetical protein